MSIGKPHSLSKQADKGTAFVAEVEESLAVSFFWPLNIAPVEFGDAFGVVFIIVPEPSIRNSFEYKLPKKT